MAHSAVAMVRWSWCGAQLTHTISEKMRWKISRTAKTLKSKCKNMSYISLHRRSFLCSWTHLCMHAYPNYVTTIQCLWLCKIFEVCALTYHTVWVCSGYWWLCLWKWHASIVTNWNDEFINRITIDETCNTTANAITFIVGCFAGTDWHLLHSGVTLLLSFCIIFKCMRFSFFFFRLFFFIEHAI